MDTYQSSNRVIEYNSDEILHLALISHEHLESHLRNHHNTSRLLFPHSLRASHLRNYLCILHYNLLFLGNIVLYIVNHFHMLHCSHKIHNSSYSPRHNFLLLFQCLCKPHLRLSTKSFMYDKQNE